MTRVPCASEKRSLCSTIFTKFKKSVDCFYISNLLVAHKRDRNSSRSKGYKMVLSVANCFDCNQYGSGE